MKKQIVAMVVFAILMFCAPFYAAADSGPTAAQTMARTAEKVADHGINSSSALAVYAKEQAEALGGILKTAGKKTFDVLAQEVPIIVEELLWWKSLESLVVFIPSLFCLVFMQYQMWKSVEYGGTRMAAQRMYFERSGTDPWFFVPMMAYVLSGVALALMYANLVWLKIAIAPRIYLIEYGLSLVQ